MALSWSIDLLEREYDRSVRGNVATKDQRDVGGGDVVALCGVRSPPITALFHDTDTVV
jgi:hypothetical protein